MTNMIDKNTGHFRPAPGGKSPLTYIEAVRDEFAHAVEDAQQEQYLLGFQAGQRSERRYQRVGDKVDVICFSALAFAAGVAVGLYCMAPAF